ncbi:hypothetical protein UK23_17455 [Lentzea aerocolonigenes]|uniref:Uncharacterized protein n=1 Tax=Lentzea aerocolonigenes TaxID=68170 RepID=A0A0F0GXT4_LENAE|nr:hypothetical protein UK23_17455 [Lentzea aerocolonigenes]
MTLVVGSMAFSEEALWESTLVEVVAVALRPDWTLPNALAPASAWAMAWSFAAFREGTAKRPIGPIEYEPRLRPRKPLEIDDRRDCRSPALPWRRDIEESFMEKPALPLGPDPVPVGGGGGAGWDGAGFVGTDGLGLTLPLAITGSPGDD